MGLVYADIKLTNEHDLGMVRANMMDRDEVKQMHVNMLVDSGAYMLTINDYIRETLQLPFLQKRKAQTADGRIVEFDVVGPVRVEFQDRSSTCMALVLPGDNEPLLGSIPMEELDVIVLPLQQKLVVNPAHPEYALMRL